MAAGTPRPQKEKTIQFWDDLYASDGVQEREWILHPSHSLLKSLHARMPQTSSAPSMVRILEIGCGNSTLSRSFLQYARDQLNGPSVFIQATDVSPVCIQQLNERDKDYLGESNRKGSLKYQVLNIVEPLVFGENDSTTLQLQPNSFDMILDKGCLDTFAFRSRQRRTQKNTLVNSVLHNVRSLLKTGHADGAPGVYVIVTPRSKFHAVRDYPGFAKVERTPLGLPKGELVDADKRETLYMYTCYRGDLQPQQVKPSSIPPSDSETCLHCGVSFLDLRKGEAVEGRGLRYWTRLFRGHAQHCKTQQQQAARAQCK